MKNSPKEEKNQCLGCEQGLPIQAGSHFLKNSGFTTGRCTKDRYQKEKCIHGKNRIDCKICVLGDIDSAILEYTPTIVSSPTWEEKEREMWQKWLHKPILENPYSSNMEDYWISRLREAREKEDERRFNRGFVEASKMAEKWIADARSTALEEVKEMIEKLKTSIPNEGVVVYVEDILSSLSALTKK